MSRATSKENGKRGGEGQKTGVKGWGNAESLKDTAFTTGITDKGGGTARYWGERKAMIAAREGLVVPTAESIFRI